MAGENDAETLPINEREKIFYQACKKQSKAANKTFNKEEMGELISDRTCENSKRAREMLMVVSSVGSIVGYKSYMQMQASRSISKTPIALTAAAAALVGLWKKTRTDQVYHNKEKKTLTFCTVPLLYGNPKCIEVDEKSLHKMGEKTIQWLKRKVNSLPDGVRQPYLRDHSLLSAPASMSAHNKDQRLNDFLYASNGEESVETEV